MAYPGSFPGTRDVPGRGPGKVNWPAPDRRQPRDKKSQQATMDGEGPGAESMRLPPREWRPKGVGLFFLGLAGRSRAFDPPARTEGGDRPVNSPSERVAPSTRRPLW